MKFYLKILPIFLMAILFSESGFAQKLTITLYELKPGIDVKEALKYVHQKSLYADNKKDLDHNQWVVVQPNEEKTLRMKPNRFYLLEVSGLKSISYNSYEYVFDPEVEGVTLSDPLYIPPGDKIPPGTKIYTHQIGEWLNYSEFRSEDLGRYHIIVDKDGSVYPFPDKRGLLYKSPKEFQGKVREFTTYVIDPEAPVSAVTIEY